jgi:hypothetical protein
VQSIAIDFGIERAHDVGNGVGTIIAGPNTHVKSMVNGGTLPPPFLVCLVGDSDRSGSRRPGFKELGDLPPKTLVPAAVLAGPVGQVMCLSSCEVGRASGEVEFSDALARHGAYEPPSPTAGMKRSGGHGNGDMDRRSTYVVPQPQTAVFRRPQIDLVLDRPEVLIAAPPSMQSIMATSAGAHILDRQDQAILDHTFLFTLPVS